MDLRFHRELVVHYMETHMYGSALFWADKVLTFSNHDPSDVYQLAQCLFHTGQFIRAATVLKTYKLHQVSLRCRHLAAKALYKAKSYEKALNMLNDIPATLKPPKSVKTTSQVNQSGDTEEERIHSLIMFLKGQVYEALSNRGVAADCYREALCGDVFCYEAFEALVGHQMLSEKEEQDLLKSLTFKKYPPEISTLVKFLYEDRLKKYSKACQTDLPPPLKPLRHNLLSIVNQAERHYYNCDFQECYRLTDMVLRKDMFYTECLPVHVACLVELKKTNALFYLAHQLVEVYPQNAVSWFAIGCYYYITGKNESSRVFLNKATTLNPLFSPAWLAYGNSFAAENEHDQAMAAYFKASQLMKGCHLPHLYIGLECGLTNNSKLAEKFFKQALAIAPEDPFVMHEMGTIAYQNHDYKGAEALFLQALNHVNSVRQTSVPEKWEPLLNNLGHVCRKLQKYEEALEFHQQALVLSPMNASTYANIGFVYALMGNTFEAVDAFHKALGLKRDHTFSTTMLNLVVEQLMDESLPFDDAFDYNLGEKKDRPASPSTGSESGSNLNKAFTGGLSDLSPPSPVADSSGECSTSRQKTARKRNSSSKSAWEASLNDMSLDVEMVDQSGVDADLESSKSDD